MISKSIKLLLRELNLTLLSFSLFIKYKSFIRPHLDDGDTV